MKDILVIVKNLEESGLLVKGVSKTIKNKSKALRARFLAFLLSTLAASALGNIY